MKVIILLLCIVLVASGDRASPAATTKIRNLRNAATSLDQMDLLTDNDIVYDASPLFNFSPGSVVTNSLDVYPPALLVDQAIQWLNFGPCAVLPPHYHPRAGNTAVVVKGRILTVMLTEGGSRLFSTNLTVGGQSVFPQASVHMMYNPGMFILFSLNLFNSKFNSRMHQYSSHRRSKQC